MVYVTHNVAEAVYLADRVLVMTPHPGMVKSEVRIALPRPRDPLSVEFLRVSEAAAAPPRPGCARSRREDRIAEITTVIREESDAQRARVN